MMTILKIMMICFCLVPLLALAAEQTQPATQASVLTTDQQQPVAPAQEPAALAQAAASTQPAVASGEPGNPVPSASLAGGPDPLLDPPPQQNEPENNLNTAEQANPIPISSADANTPSLLEKEAIEGVKVSEKQISLDLKGIEINDLLRILSLKMGLTIVPSKSVSGRINIFLNNLTFDDALDVILIIQDLACERKGNIINIMTSAEYERLYGKKYNEKRKFASFRLNYAKPATVFNALGQIKSDIGKVIADESSGIIMLIDIPEKIELMEKTAKDLDKPPQTEILDIKYAKAADLKTHLSGALTQGAGEVYVDERSGKAIISDLPDKMKKLKKMFRAFDAETRQVYIEAEVVQITLKKEYQRQINWEKIFHQRWMENLDVKSTFDVNPSFTPSPALSTANLQLTMGTLATDFNTETYKFLETFGDVKIISSPRLSVVNNQEAKVMVGTREAYVTSSQSQAETTLVTSESIQFVDVGTKLNIVPTINEDGFIIMKIKPEVSSVGRTLTTYLGNKIPIIDTSEAETTVKVKDGTTIMIAGMIKQEKRKDTTGWPILQSIPFVGAFFGSRADQNLRTEVIVFITPHIIRGDVMFSDIDPQNIVPADIVSQEVKDDIIERAVDKEIGKEIDKQKDQQKREIGAKINPAIRLSVPAVAADSAVIQGKIKGIKEH